MKKTLIISIFLLGTIGLFGQNIYRYQVKANGGISVGTNKVKLDSIVLVGTKNVKIYKGSAILYPIPDSTTGARAFASDHRADLIETSVTYKVNIADSATMLNKYPHKLNAALTGVPTAPTATASTSTTQIATTAFATTADNLKANLASPTFTGSITTGALIVGVDTCKGVRAAKSVTGIGLLRVTAACTLNGLSGGVTGQILKIVNTAATTLVLKHNGTTTQKIMISGASDLTMTDQYSAVTCVFDGTYWFICGKGQ